MTALFLMIAFEGGFGANNFLYEGLTPSWLPLKNRKEGDTRSISYKRQSREVVEISRGCK